MGIANDYTPNVDDLTAPTIAHAAFRMADEVRLIKQRLKPLYDTAAALNTAVADAQASVLAAKLAQSLAEAAKSAADLSASASAASAGAALASEQAALASAENSAESTAIAMLWAAAPYNQEVIVGSGLYSALHYATEALNIIAGDFIDDSGISLQKAYSSNKVMGLYNAQTETIKNLAGASASIINTTTPVFSPIPAVATTLPFTIVAASSDNTVVTLNDSADTITFIKNGKYNLFSMLQFKVTTDSPKVIRVDIVNTATSATIVTQNVTVAAAANTTTTLPLNTLVVVNTAPVTVKVMITLVTDSGISLNAFNGIIASSSGSGSGGATGGGADTVFYLNGQTVTANYTIPTGQNAMSAGPISIANGVTVTISDGSVWTVV